MDYECIWFDTIPEIDWAPGWCFYMGHEHQLSKHYKENVASIRRPITVCLPDRERPGHVTTFCIDRAPTNNPDNCWQVTVDMSTLVNGRKPDITVSPSINCEGAYHGFLEHGIVKKDLG